MPKSPLVHPRMLAFGPMLLVCLSIVLAAPAAALAATGGDAGCEDSRAAQALGESSCGEGSVASEESARGDGAEPVDEPAPADADDPTVDGGAETSAPPSRRTSRADAALQGSGAGRSLEEQLDERSEAIRREARERREATRRRARSAGAEEESSGPAGDRDDEIIITAAGSGEQIRLLPGRRDILVRNRALVRGYIPARVPGRSVVLEVRTGGRWVEVDRVKTVEDGRFYLAWYPSRPGYFRVRVRPYSTTTSTEPSDPRLLYIYRTAVASWYGPGFYGNTTACGQTFTSRLLGVAHKTLPCGYRLTVRYNGRARTVRVVDRGPYTRGRDYDLTEALRDYLRFDGVDEVWVTA